MAFQFSSLQSLGRALMLPIAMLPVAGLLLRFGQPDLLNVVAIANAGSVIFENLPLLFALGVAVGLAKDNNGAAAMAAAVGYLILVGMLKTINPEIDTGVLGGILIGSIAGGIYNKYKDISLPEFLAFFGGKRFIPIATGALAVVVAEVLGYVWPPIQHALHWFSQWLANSGELGLFLYGLCNRLLLITGLHHVLNSLVWFQLGDYVNAKGVVVHGDIARFMAGDPSAGYFQAGFFPIMMFGLPAICLAMYSCAHSKQRKAVAGLLLSMALTSFLTGVTEPIEYSFVFLAPILYVIHAILTGISLATMEVLHVHLGFSFSAGAIDYVLFFKLAQHPLLMLPVGCGMFILYYGLAVFFIRKFDLATIGREQSERNPQCATQTQQSLEMQFIQALGGVANLQSVDACTTRLRLTVAHHERVDLAELKALGAKGVVKPSPTTLQVIVGPQAEIIASKMRELLNNLAQTLPENEIIAGLGGRANLVTASVVALTRVKIEVNNAALIKREQLMAAGVIAIIDINPSVKQLYLGTSKAAELAARLNQN